MEVDEKATLSVWKHTIPYFIPLKQIEQDHLNSNIKVNLQPVDLFFF
jgi:hypothetical protein